MAHLPAAVVQTAFGNLAALAPPGTFQGLITQEQTNMTNALLPSTPADREAAEDQLHQECVDWQQRKAAGIEVVPLFEERVCWLALALRLRRGTELAHPNMILNLDDPNAAHAVSTQPTLANDDDKQQMVLCPAVLESLGLLPNEIVLEPRTLRMLLDAVESGARATDDGYAHADAMPHNWGFQRLVWDPERMRLLGYNAMLFDAKHQRRAVPDAGPDWRCCRRDQGLARDMEVAWRVAATWATAAAEYDRQPALQAERSLLYTQYWHACTQRLAVAAHALDAAATVVINLGAFSDPTAAPINLQAVHATLDLRSATSLAAPRFL